MNKKTVRTGKEKIDWAEKFMPVLNQLTADSDKFRGVKIGAALHIEPKTAVLIRALNDAGAEVTLAPCNPLSTQEDTVLALRDEGITVYGERGMSEEEYWDTLGQVLETDPKLILDDGGDLTHLLHHQYSQIEVKGASEETTTGVTRARQLEEKSTLRFPVLAVNDAKMKSLFDNQFGTGESSVFGFLNATNLTIAGKTVVVAGYGWVGRGIARRMKGMGAKAVIVTEINPIRAVEALFNGYQVSPMRKAIQKADIVITATGNKDIVRKEHLKVAKDGCILANAGHFNVEVDVNALDDLAVQKRDLRKFGSPYNQQGEFTSMVQEYTLNDGRHLYLIANGRLLNLVAGQGHATEIMDLSFSLQFLAVRYILDNDLPAKVISLPSSIDRKVARLKLDAMNTTIDKLTKRQKKYWKSKKHRGE